MSPEITQINTVAIENRVPSYYGLPQRQMVSVGTVDEQEYMQLGGVRQVTLAIDVVKRGTDANLPVSTYQVMSALRHIESESGLDEAGLPPKPLEQIQSAIRDGEQLIEGEYTIVSRPGHPSIRIPEQTAVWAPTQLALGDNWKLIEPTSTAHE